MPGFFDFKTEKWPVWGLFASVVVVFIGLTMVFKDSGSSSTASRQPALKCDSEECTYTARITREEKLLLARKNFEDLATEKPEEAELLLDRIYQMEMEFELSPGMEDMFSRDQLVSILLMSWGTTSGPPFKCPDCGQGTVWDAIACQNPESCDTIFFRGEYDAQYGDRCPECEYSRREARQQESYDDKQRIIDKRKELKDKKKKK